MEDNQAIAMVYAFMFCLGLIFGMSIMTNRMSANDLCEKQFNGEMKNGKCVRITAEEIK